MKYKGSLSEYLGYYLEDVGFTLLERVKFTGGANGAELADENLSQVQGVINDVKFNASKLNLQVDENLNDPKSGKNAPSARITSRLGRGILASRLPLIKLKITRLGDYGLTKRKKAKARKLRKQIWARRSIK